jgi:GNAT superfamily N-acetyltransferase
VTKPGSALDQSLYATMAHYARQGVLVQLLYRSGRIAIASFQVDQVLRGHGRARQVLTEICRWADAGGHTLGITPSGQWGADLQRLRKFLSSLGFVPNGEEPPMHDALIRPPRGSADALLREAIRAADPYRDLQVPGPEVTAAQLRQRADAQSRERKRLNGSTGQHSCGAADP